MTTLNIDVAIIGAGTAGLRARRAARAQGASTLLIEGGVHGTTCARVGCMPSKLLIAAADAAWHVQHAPRFGVEAAYGAHVNGPAVLRRVQAERDRFVGFVVRDVEALDPSERLEGWARFVGPSALQVGDTRVEAGAVVVATGSTPVVPPALADLGEVMLSNEEVFELPDLPRSVAVIGTGVIGLELGQALHRLGVHVRLFAHNDRLGPLTDPAVAASARRIFSAELQVHLYAPIEAAERVEGGARLHWREAGEPREEVFERVLVAAGRAPSVRRLGLEAAGVAVGERGAVAVDPATHRAGETAVFFAGDVLADRSLLHEAADEGFIAGSNAGALARGLPVEPYQRRAPLAVVFTDPQIALVGQRYADLAGTDFGIGEVDYGDQGRSRVMGRNQGLVRIYGAPDGRLLGAEMCGPAVEHTGHLLAWALQVGMTVTDALRMPFYHPVVEEGIRTALRDLARALGLAGAPEIVKATI
ncbi:MAG: dihydrolipoyl dehydrogenase [Myxococcales bacterium]|nr:dihydrolipoyl dehydrogenase [Myxococcales bacterium]